MLQIGDSVHYIDGRRSFGIQAWVHMTKGHPPDDDSGQLGWILMREIV